MRAYVDGGFNVAKAAKILHVHPNTVVYRLRRIRELTERDIRDPNQLPILVLALEHAELTGRDPASAPAPIGRLQLPDGAVGHSVE